ncbi:MAG: hypothetical protein ABSD97_11295 [Acidimicrobiales bacterium]|jgi:hypothetical protein
MAPLETSQSKTGAGQNRWPGCYFSQVQATFPDRVGPVLTGGALAKLKEPDPFACTVIDALAVLAAALYMAFPTMMSVPPLFKISAFVKVPGPL